MHPLKQSYAPVMVPVFKKMFKNYLSHMYSSDFILESMAQDKTQYFGALYEGKLIGISTAECDIKNKNEGLANFVIVPGHREKKLANHLLHLMEIILAAEGFKTLYTLARLHSLPMK